MDKKEMQNLKGLGILFSIGTTIAAGVILGYVVGNWLDKKLGTSPWLAFLLLMLGLAGGLKSVYDSTFPDKEGSE